MALKLQKISPVNKLKNTSAQCRHIMRPSGPPRVAQP